MPLEQDKKIGWILSALGSIVVIWLAILIAPTLHGGLWETFPIFMGAIAHPFQFSYSYLTIPLTGSERAHV